MRFLLLTLLLFPVFLKAQSLGGRTVYNFLEQANPAQVTALGGMNISTLTSDPAIGFNMPSLLREESDQHIAASFQSIYGGIKNYQIFGAWHSKKLATVFSGGVHYFSYGTIDQTDAGGNQFGELRLFDYIAQAGFSRTYLQHWRYGGNIKFIHSSYGIYRSSGMAVDLSVSYTDTARKFQAGLLLRNMGAQLTAYEGTEKDILPFDIQLGISKRLENAPVQFSFTAHHLNQFDLLYADTSFNNNNGFSSAGGGFRIDKVFAHMVVATQIYIGDKIELSAGYNHLRRKQLNIGKTGNGLNGFSMGIGLTFKLIDIRYSRSYYQNNQSFHQLGIAFSLRGK